MTNEFNDTMVLSYDEGVENERQRWLNILAWGCNDRSCIIHEPTETECPCLKVLSPAQRLAFVRALGQLRLEAVRQYKDACISRLNEWISSPGAPHQWKSGLEDSRGILADEVNRLGEQNDR